MSIELFQQIEQDVKMLDNAEKSKLIDILVRSLQDNTLPEQGTKKKRSLLELRGLGKDIWEGIDALEYVQKERDSWES